MIQPHILVACVGNIFLGDDAFGVEVARRLSRRTLPEGVRVEDFGIRGFDLALALIGGPNPVILVDAAPRGEPPGTLYVIEPDLPASGPGVLPGPAAIETHGIDPEMVLKLAVNLGGELPRVLLVGCEPSPMAVDESALCAGLSPPVEAAVDEAVGLIESLVQRLLSEAALPGVAAATNSAPAAYANIPGPVSFSNPDTI